MNSRFRILVRSKAFFQISYRQPLFHLDPTRDQVPNLTQMSLNPHLNFRLDNIKQIPQSFLIKNPQSINKLDKCLLSWFV